MPSLSESNHNPSIFKTMRSHLSRSLATLAAVVSLVIGCTDLKGPKKTEYAESDVLTRVIINTEAVIMKVSDSIQLSAQILTIDGKPLETVGADNIEWLSASPLDATIDDGGVLRSWRVVSNPIRVIAKVTHKGVTKADTVPVYITANSYSASSVRVVAIDSNRMDFNGVITPRIRIDVYNGDDIIVKGARIHIEPTIPGIAIDYAGLGGDLGDAIFSVRNTPAYLGKFYIRVKGNLYGTEVADSLEFYGDYSSTQMFRVTYDSLSDRYTVENHAVSPGVDQLPIIQKCGYVTIFVEGNKEAIDLLFSDSVASVSECDPTPTTYMPEYMPAPVVPALGGNLYVPPRLPGNANNYISQRRSGIIGNLTIRARLSASKQVIGDSIVYEYRSLNRK